MEYRIGELAKALQISTDTLRFYEKSGLLLSSKRTASGYRIYNELDRQTLGFILRAKSVGFTLVEIHELLGFERNKERVVCGDVKTLVDAKRAEILNKISELQAFERSLKTLSDACCGGDESALHCSILQTLEEEKGGSDALSN